MIEMDKKAAVKTLGIESARIRGLFLLRTREPDLFTD